MFLQEYEEKWVDVGVIRTSLFHFEAGTRRPTVLVATVELQLAMPTPRIWTATSPILLTSSA